MVVTIGGQVSSCGRRRGLGLESERARELAAVWFDGERTRGSRGDEQENGGGPS